MIPNSKDRGKIDPIGNAIDPPLLKEPPAAAALTCPMEVGTNTPFDIAIQNT